MVKCEHLLGFNLIRHFSEIFHFWEPHFTFIWPFITLHDCNQTKSLKNKSNISITVFVENRKSLLGNARREHYHWTVARPKRMLMMAGIKSNFAVQWRFQLAFVVQVWIKHIVVGIVTKAIRLSRYASPVFLIRVIKTWIYLAWRFTITKIDVE